MTVNRKYPGPRTRGRTGPRQRYCHILMVPKNTPMATTTVMARITPMSMRSWFQLAREAANEALRWNIDPLEAIEKGLGLGMVSISKRFNEERSSCRRCWLPPRPWRRMSLEPYLSGDCIPPRAWWSWGRCRGHTRDREVRGMRLPPWLRIYGHRSGEGRPPKILSRPPRKRAPSSSARRPSRPPRWCARRGSSSARRRRGMSTLNIFGGAWHPEMGKVWRRCPLRVRRRGGGHHRAAPPLNTEASLAPIEKALTVYDTYLRSEKG